MGMPWHKTPNDMSVNFRFFGLNVVNQRHYLFLLMAKGRGVLDQDFNDADAAFAEQALNGLVANALNISRPRAVKLKQALLLAGLIDEHWQPLDWDALHGENASYKAAGEGEQPKKFASPGAKRTAECRARKKAAANEAVTAECNACNAPVTHVTDVTTDVTDVTKPVTKPVTNERYRGLEKQIKNQQVTSVTLDRDLDVDLERDLEKENIKSIAAQVASDPTASAASGSALEHSDEPCESDCREPVPLPETVKPRKKTPAELKAEGHGVAAILIDTFFANEGIPRLPDGYLARAAQLVHAAGGLLIVDEVQSGFARTGAHLWGHQAHPVKPDIVTLGKPMGNGFPLAGLVTRRDLIEAFGRHNMYFNTFGGSPLAARVGQSVLDVIEDEDLQGNALRQGERLRAGLERLAERHPLIGDVRGSGLFFAVELVQDRATRTPATIAARQVVEAMRQDGVLIGKIGKGDHILKIRPPLVFTAEHGELLLDTLDRALAAV